MKGEKIVKFILSTWHFQFDVDSTWARIWFWHSIMTKKAGIENWSGLFCLQCSEWNKIQWASVWFLRLLLLLLQIVSERGKWSDYFRLSDQKATSRRLSKNKKYKDADSSRESESVTELSYFSLFFFIYSGRVYQIWLETEDKRDQNWTLHISRNHMYPRMQ